MNEEEYYEKYSHLLDQRYYYVHLNFSDKPVFKNVTLVMRLSVSKTDHYSEHVWDLPLMSYHLPLRDIVKVGELVPLEDDLKRYYENETLINALIEPLI